MIDNQTISNQVKQSKQSQNNSAPDWTSIEQHPDFQTLDFATQKKARNKYFDSFIAPRDDFKSLDSDTQALARTKWNDWTPPATKDQNSGLAGDLVTSVEKGVLDLPGMVTGLADIVPALITGSRPFDKITDTIGEATGFQPSKWSKELNKDYSQKHKQQQYKINQAWQDKNKTGWDVAAEYAKNPGYVLNQIAESLPSMAVGGFAGRGAMLAGKAIPALEGVATKIAPEAIGYLERKFGKEAAAAIAGGLGEGLVQTGQLMDQATGQDQRKNAVAALISGAADALIAGGAGKIAQSIGLETADTLMAKGLQSNLKKELSLGKRVIGRTGKITAGAASEGVLQEFPQSAQEQIWQNYADGKPLFEGVSRASIEGALAGMFIGAGANAISNTSTTPDTNTYEGQLQNHVDNIKSNGIDKIPTSIEALTQKINQNNQMMQDQETLDALATESGYKPEELQSYLKAENKFNQDLITKLQEELDKSSEEQVSKNTTVQQASIDEVINQQQITNAVQQANQEQQKQDLDNRIKALRKAYLKMPASNEKESLGNTILNLVNARKALDEQTIQEDQSFKTTFQPSNEQTSYTDILKQNKNPQELARSLNLLNEAPDDQTTNEEKQAFYEKLFSAIPINKDAAESATVMQENLPPEILTQKGTPYKNRTILEKRISLLDNANDYIIVDTPEGFIGIKKTSVTEDSLANDSQSSFKNEQQIPTASQVNEPVQVMSPMELQDKLNANQQQLNTIVEQLKTTTDPVEQRALQEEGALLYEQNTALQTQFDKQNQSIQKQLNQPITLAEATAETANIEPQFQTTEQLKTAQFNFVKDNHGNDLIGYHGTASEPFASFDNSKTQSFEHGWSGDGHYFTLNKDYAKGYADIANNITGKPGRIIEARFTFKNPLYKNSLEYKQILKNAIGKISILTKEDGVKATNAFKLAGYDAVIDGPSLDKAFEINVFDSKDIHYAPGQNQFQTTEQSKVNQINLDNIEKIFPGQEIIQDTNRTINVRFKNGKGLTIKSIQDVGDGFIQLAIETGQMSKNGKILGITQGNNILLNENFADDRTLWHENKHVLDNLGIITKEDNAALNKEFNKLRRVGKLEFALSTHEDPIKRMEENRANMFAQIMANREAYRNTIFGKVIQRVMDFFQRLLAFGKQTIAGLAREVETGKIYERKVNGQTVQTTVPQSEVMAEKWYSAVENAVKGFQQKQALPEQWKGMIKNIPGVKQTELDWIGLDDWLDKQKGKVTKDALLKFIQDNNVQLEEVVKEQNFLTEKELDNLYIELVHKNGYDNSQDMPEEIKQKVTKEYNILLDQYGRNRTRFNDADYVLPNGKNYKELLITLENNSNSNYQSDHFDEPNILAHVRFNERTDADGNKVLFIEEIQSDWHQEGRKLGYQKYPTFNVIKKYAKQRGIRIDTPPYKDLSAKVLRQLRQAADKEGESALLEDVLDQHTKEIDSLEYGEKVPNAPMKKTWPLLAMKRMVRYAAENGFDKIAWTTGKQQGARYGSPGFKWLKHPDGSIEVAANPQINDLNADAWNNYSFIETTIKTIQNKQELYDYIEKTLDAQIGEYSPENWKKYITEQTNKLWKQIHDSFEGIYYPRLEGMKGFYNKALPQILNKEFNKGKWGKAKVEIIDLPDIGQQLALPITKRMKKKALREGMPQFKARELSVPEQALGGLLNKKTDTNTPEFKKWFNGSIAVKPDGSPIEFYHGTNEVFDTFDPNKESKTTHTTSTLGHFFTTDKKTASAYGQHVLPVYLHIQNPYKMSFQEATSLKTLEESKQRQQELINEGYDSIIMETGTNPYVIVFDSSQVKSVYNQGNWKAADNIYFETREQTEPKQKISDAEYNELFKQKANLIQKFIQTAKIHARDLKHLTDRLTGSISTRLANANPMLRDKVRRLDFDTSQRIIKILHTAKPLLDSLSKMFPEDKHAWNIARIQGDTAKINQIAERYGLQEHQEKLREELNQIRQDARDVGYDVGFIDEYWPRIIKDTEGFLKATQEISQHPEFTDALKEKAKQMGISFEQLNSEFPEIRADVISNMILGKHPGIGGPGNIKSRVYDTVPKELLPYYMNSDAALMRYIYSMSKKIEARKFFGKIPQKVQLHKLAIAKAKAELLQIGNLKGQEKRKNELNDLIKLHEEKLNQYKEQRDYTENIGAYVDELMLTGKLHKKDEHIVRQILNARFNEHGTTGIVNAYKNMAYIDVMGSVTSAMTQIADTVWAAYVGKVWTPKGFLRTAQNIARAIIGKSKMTKEELGIERIAQEFADGTTLGKAVSKVFWAVGLTKLDSIGKEALLNNVLMNYQDQVKTQSGIEALKKKIRPTFGRETDQVIKDLISGEHSDNVKMLVYSRVLDFQPVALSEMPEFYLNGGNRRVFYMLKTFTLKQMDVFRNEVFHELASKDPKRVAQGIKNMVALTSLLVLANAGVDELKDYVLGKETRFKDNVIENFMSLGGASRYMRMQVTRKGIFSAGMQQILPPFKFFDAVGSDIHEKIVTGDIAKGLRSVDSIPLFGKLWYWHYGRGSQLKRTLNEQDFSKVGKKVRKFQKQLDKAINKRLFLQTHPTEFKQMMLYKNISKSLNKNKKMINSLKKLKQTPLILKRIGQLEKQQKLIYARYFEMAKKIQ